MDIEIAEYPVRKPGLLQRFWNAIQAIQEWYRRPVVSTETDEEKDARQW